MNDRSASRVREWRLAPSIELVRRGEGTTTAARRLTRFGIVVDDENSRSASDAPLPGRSSRAGQARVVIRSCSR
ncbi:MAG TPA: hypothetical protein VHH32_10255 [Gemmatimonadales bacterium]|nr:hypothetical protein [Gemmatimonadales bacterium]